jgi:hypothetical protein
MTQFNVFMNTVLVYSHIPGLSDIFKALVSVCMYRVIQVESAKFLEYIAQVHLSEIISLT